MVSNKETSKKTVLILILIAICLIAILVFSILDSKNNSNTYANTSVKDSGIETESSAPAKKVITVVPTMQDEIKENTSWCGTFQLVWNDMQDELVGGKVVLSEPVSIADNLNQQTFKKKDIPEDYYFTMFGVMSFDLKMDIQNGIKEKFNETSDIISQFNWPTDNEIDPNRYFFYSMLKRKFEFENEFNILENSKFGNVEDIQYFGINEKTELSVREQVEVNYYNSNSDFAVTLLTKDGDKVLLIRNPEGTTFEQIYENANKKQEEFTGDSAFAENDTLKVPNINMKVLKEYDELEGKSFQEKSGKTLLIEKAVQSIQMQLDNTGGEVKSEAALSTNKEAVVETSPREFNFNDKFAIFLLTEKDVPYFASNIQNIEIFK